jgi:nicotinamidase-related amidase
MSAKIDPNDTLVLLIDLQAGIADKASTSSYKDLQKGVTALCRLARIFEMPVVVSAIHGPDGKEAKIMPEIKNALGELPVHYRTTADSLENEAIKAAVEATGRKTILISGAITEIAVQMPALSGTALGYRVFVVVEGVRGFSPRTEEAAFHRILQAGISVSRKASRGWRFFPN